MRVLIVATKAPWPPVDGGRLLLLRTIEGLAAAGAAVTLAAPVDVRRQDLRAVGAALAPLCEPALVAVRPAAPLAWGRALGLAAVGGAPLSIARHTVPALRRRVGGLLAAGRFDVVHAEQLQALAQALRPARRAGVPVVLRAQNVESALWAAAAGTNPLLAFEARRLAAWEGRAVGAVDASAALTAIDLAALSRLAAAAGAAGARVVQVPAPFAAELPAGSSMLPGDPAVVVFGSSGWRPNEDAVRWFAADIWPAVRRTLPAARLHVFGGGEGVRAGGGRGEGEGIELHRAPADSADAFAPGTVHVVPLRFGSGIRMKILEAWARGVPVVATAEGAAGLAAGDGQELLVARDAATFAAALRRLHDEPGLSASLIRAGRAALRVRHDPAAATASLLDLYDSLPPSRRGVGDRK